MKANRLILFFAIVAFCNIENIQATSLSDSVTIYPEEYSRAIRNPLKGFREWNTNTLNEWATTGKYYIGWNELENSAYDGVEKIIDWTNAHWGGVENKNFKVIPRVYLHYPDRELAWPDDMTDYDYTSDQFKTRVKAFVKKLGQAWDNDSRIAYIEMGIIGKWGEQHSPEPSEEMQAILAGAFMDAFKIKKVVRRYPLHFVDYNFGIYWDSFAHTNEVDVHEPAMIALGDYWKTAIIEGETAYNWGEYRTQPGDGPDDTVIDTVHRYYLEDLIYELHCSGLGWITHYDASNPDAKVGGEEVQKTFGYRFVIDDFSCPKRIEKDSSFNVSFSVENKGSAPFYYNWPVELSLLDESKNVVWKQNFNNVDIRTWYPGDNYNKVTNLYEIVPEVYHISSTFKLNKPLPSGKYTIALAVLDPAGNLPSLRFAIKNYFKGGRHPMAYIGVGEDLVNFEINTNEFDDIHADKSLHYKKTALVNGEGLLANWKFDGNINDASVNMFNGVVNGNSVYVDGKFDKAIDFASADKYMDVDNDAFGLESYTISLWVKYPGSVPQMRTTFIEYDRSGSNLYGLYKGENGKVYSPCGDGSVVSSTELAADKWYHIAVTYTDGTEKLFIDGSLEASQDELSVAFASSTLRVGANLDGGEFVQAYIDEVRIYNKALSEDEIYLLSQITYRLSLDVDGLGEIIQIAPESGTTIIEGTEVILKARVKSGNEFIGWGGDISEADTIVSFTMTKDMYVKASFDVIRYYFTATVIGEGSVSPNNGSYTGIIDIIATPDEGYRFEGWTGDVTASDGWQVLRMDSSINVTATFVPLISVFNQSDYNPHFRVYPNPFIHSASIQYQVDSSANVKLSIYNMMGQQLIVLVDKMQHESLYSVEWNGVDAFGNSMGKGLYLSVLQIGDSVFTGKLIFVGPGV